MERHCLQSIITQSCDESMISTSNVWLEIRTRNGLVFRDTDLPHTMPSIPHEF